MDEHSAYQLAGLWAQAHRRRAPQASELVNEMASALTVVPGGLPWAVAVPSSDLYPLLLLSGAKLWRVEVTATPESEGDHAQVEIAYVALTPEHCRLSVTQRWGTDSSSGVLQGFWNRAYRLQVFHAGAAPLDVTLEGREILQGHFAGEPRLDREEQFGRALAAAVGWNHQKREPSTPAQT